LALPIPDEQKIENWLGQSLPQPRVLAPLTGFTDSQLRELEEVAGELADQRTQLTEHWEQVLRVQAEWEEERQAISAEVVAVIYELKQQAQELLKREHLADRTQHELQRRQEELLQLRQHLVGWQGRLRAQEIDLAADRERAAAENKAREALIEQQRDQLNELRQQWLSCQSQELEGLRTEQLAFQKAQQEYLNRGAERRQQARELHEQRCSLTAQALALEQYRQKYLAKARDKAAAARALERLSRRWSRDRARLLEVARKEAEELQAELQRFQAEYQEVHKKLAQSEAEREALTRRRTEWEREQVHTDGERHRLLQALRTVEAQRDRTQLQITELHDELERIARQLLTEPLPPRVLRQTPRKVDPPSAVDRAA
jgi:hypothetical protein